MKQVFILLLVGQTLCAQELAEWPNNPSGKWNVQLNSGISVPLQLMDQDVEFDLSSPGWTAEIKFDYELRPKVRVHLGVRYSQFNHSINTKEYSALSTSFDPTSHYIESEINRDSYFDITEFVGGIGYDVVLGNWVVHPGIQLGIGSMQFDYWESMFVKRMDEHYWFSSDLTNEMFGTTGYSISSYLLVRRPIWKSDKFNLGAQIMTELNYNRTDLKLNYSSEDYLENFTSAELDIADSFLFMNSMIGLSFRF